MAETTGKSTAKKNYNKIGTEDDPIIIAQRFLNIFRQLHIFSAERKDAFNKMILEQPAEIRGMFSSLPGGSVLQQYVDDLEEQYGVVRSKSDSLFPENETEEQTKAKILANALAEANPQPQAIPEQDREHAARLVAQAAAEAAAKVAAETKAQIAAEAARAAKEAAAQAQAQLAAQTEALAQMQAQLQAQAQAQAQLQAQAKTQAAQEEAPIQQAKTIFQPISSTFTADPSFAQEIASAVKEAIVVTESSRKKDSEEITKAIVDSQNKLAEIMVQNNSANIEAQNRLAQMLVQNNTASNASSSNNNANNIQINTAATFPPVEEMLSGIVKVQSELFKEMAKTQTSELSSIISLALKESQQLSTQSIITAIREMQKENLKFLQMHPIAYSQPSPQAKEPVVSAYEPAEKTFRAEPIRPRPEEPINMPKAAEFAPQANDISREIFGDEMTDEDEETTNLLLQEEEIVSPKKKKKKKKKKKNSEGLSLDGLASSLFNKVSTLTDKVSSLSGKKVFEEETVNEDDIDEETADLTNNIASGQPEKLSNDENGLDISLFDSDDKDAEKPLLLQTPINEAVEDNATATEEEWEYVEVPAEEILPAIEAAVFEETPAEETSAVFEEAPTKEEDWEYIEAPAEEEPAPIEEPAPVVEAAMPEETAGEEEDWEYIEAPAGEEPAPIEEPAPVVEAATAKETAKEEEAWEYVEAPAEEEAPAEAETAPVVEAAPVAEEIPAEEAAEEWTWEYEDNPETDISSNPADVTPASFAEAPLSENIPLEDSNSGEEGEWEWEYEEVPEDEEIAAADNAADEEWEYVEVPEDEAQSGDEEWEYVEVPEDKAEASEEGEWEYVEIPEGEEEAEELSGEEGDWEWEYEEVPEDEAETAETTSLSVSAESASDRFKTETTGFNDPYRTDSSTPALEESENTSLSSMYTGEVYFDDKVYQTPDKQDSESAFTLPEDFTDGLGLPDLDNSEGNTEPYTPKGTI